MSSVLDLFGEWISEEVRQLARERLLGRVKNLVPRGCDRATREKATLAWLLIKEINPELRPNQSEVALLLGVAERTLRGKYRSGR